MTRNVFACDSLMLQAQSEINCSEECSNMCIELTHLKHSMTSYHLSILMTVRTTQNNLML